MMKGILYPQVCYFSILLLLITTSAFAQNLDEAYGYYERKTDPQIHVSLEHRQVQPAYQYQTSSSITVQVNTDENGQDILFDAANEPSIAVDPLNTDRMVIGWRQFDTIGSSFRQAGIAITNNAGGDWTTLEPLEAGVFRSDPVLAADNYGNFFYNSLTDNPFRCHVFESQDMLQWSDAIDAKGGDKQWMTVDNTGGTADGNLYASWNENYSVCDGRFTRSRPGNLSFDECVSTDPQLRWGNLAVGIDGDVYEIGQNTGRIYVNRMMANDFTEDVYVEQSSVVDLAGRLSFGSSDGLGPNPQGLRGQSWVEVDHSYSRRRGFVYALATTIPGANQRTDVYFSRSEDQGQTWTRKTRIPDGPANHWYWFGTMSVAPNGRIDVFWLDGRTAFSVTPMELYYSYSLDGGDTWSPNERLSEPFNPMSGFPQQQKMGDYFHSVSANDTVYLAWAATFNGGQDVYFTKVAPTLPVNINETALENSYRLYPSIAHGDTEFFMQAAQSESVTIAVYNSFGHLLVQLSTNLHHGINNLGALFSDGIAGAYFVKITDADGHTHTHRILIL